MLTPVTDNLVVYIGRDNVFEYDFWQDRVGGAPYDLTGCTLAAECRERMDADSDLIFTFDISSEPAEGKVRLSVSREVTNAVSVSAAHFDFAITDSLGRAATYIYGRITFINMPTVIL